MINGWIVALGIVLAISVYVYLNRKRLSMLLAMRIMELQLMKGNFNQATLLNEAINKDEEELLHRKVRKK